VPFVPLVSGDSDAIVSPAAPVRQKGRKYMSKRQGQLGSLRVIGSSWVGRYWRDVPGIAKREHPSVVLGRTSVMTKTAAKRKLMDIIEKEGVNTAEHLEKCLKPAVTFNAIADAWELKRLPQLKPSTQYSAPMLIKKHLRPFFGPMAPEAIKTGIINDWLAGLNSKGLEPKTVHNMWKQFRTIMNWQAQQNDEQKRMWYPTLPQIRDDEQRWFTQQETQDIVNAAHGQYRVLFHLAGNSGLRFGELVGLHVEDVDFVRSVIHVRRSVWHGMEVSTKTRKGVRPVFVDSGTVQSLKEHLGTRTSGRVFQTRTGTPLENHNVVRQVLKPICERLGIAPGGMHAFRHGRVSHLQANNVPTDFTKAQVGHSSLRTTALYTHFSEQFVHETVERLASKLMSCTQVA
jgi:integrase